MNTPIASGPMMMLKALGIDPQKAMEMISSLQQAGNDLTKAVEAVGVQITEMRSQMDRIETLLQEQRQTGVTENAERKDRSDDRPSDAGRGGPDHHGGSTGADTGADTGEIAE